MRVAQPGRSAVLEAALIEAISDGLPLVKRPYAALAARLACSESDVIEGIKSIIAEDKLKRFGIVVRHRKLGYRANGMVVWDIPDHRLSDLGQRIGQYSFVTLCYQRPRRLPAWRYNLFSMIHGLDRRAVIDQVEYIAEQCDMRGIDHEILFSKRCFKQRGANHKARQPQQLEQAHNG